MKTNVWNTLVLWVSLALLFFLNFYTLAHAIFAPVAVAVLFLFLFFARRFLLGLEERILNRAALTLWLLLLGAQVSYVLLLHSNIRYDAFWLLDQAVEMLETHQISPTLSNGYFSQVPNNYGLTIITYWFLSLVRALGLPSSCFMQAVELLNVCFMDLSLLFIFLFIRETRGKASSLFFLLFCALSPYPYVWAPYYYTSTTSMMFACAAVFLWLRLCRTASAKKQCLIAAMMGLLCITGFQVRATSFIAYIAILLYWSVTRKKGSLKKYARPLLVFFLTALLSFFSWKGIVAHYVPFDTRDTALPVTHFMMMGSRGDGSFNQDDLRYSISLPTKEAKLKGTVDVIKERLLENGLRGNLRLLFNKQLNCWEDGTDAYRAETGLCTDFTQLHTYVLGSKSWFLAAYAQVFRSLQLFLVCLYCVFFLWKRRKDKSFLLALNLLGGMTFHLLWEAGPLYSIAFTYFSYAVAAEAFAQLEESRVLAGKKASLSLFCLSSLCLAFSLLFLARHWKAATSEVILVSDFVANQHMETAGEPGPAMETGDLWVQTFQAETPFNALELYFGNSGQEGNTSSYRITLTDEADRLLHEEILYGDSTGYDLTYPMEFETVIPEKRSVYTISIRPLFQDSSHFIHFGSQDTSRVDLYPYGELFVNGKATGRDLSFRVSNRHLAYRATKKEYGLFAILLLLLELLLIFKTSRLVHQERRPVS